MSSHTNQCLFGFAAKDVQRELVMIAFTMILMMRVGIEHFNFNY